MRVLNSSTATEATGDQVKPAGRKIRASSHRVLAYKMALLATILLLGGELVSRAFWVFERNAPFWSSNIIKYSFYPQLRPFDDAGAVIANADEVFDVLILGGSTISADFGSVGTHLQTGLQERLRRPVRVFNLALAAHNSRDSMLKHRWLEHHRFDLVVIYDGINDTRMNNAPAELFREDYSHCQWYKNLNLLDQHPVLFQAALPFTVAFTADRVADACGLTWSLPRMNPRDDWMEYGNDVKTGKTFRSNVAEIVTRAQRKGERVVLMTFAYHIPANYSLAAFKARQLDYGPKARAPVELWGKPSNVVAALDLQNGAAREIAGQNPNVVFIDQQRLMPCNRDHFKDCCHFTEEGCTLFAHNILTALDARKMNQLPDAE